MAHRDIKPDNIIIVNNKLKLADFGLSTDPIVGGSRTKSQIVKGSIVGTVMWMAPEILDKFSHFSDLGDLKMKELVRYY